MKLNVWIPKNTTIFIGGDPAKGSKPVITAELPEPQLLIDTEAGTVTIVTGDKK